MKLNNHEIELMNNYLSTIERHYYQNNIQLKYLKNPYKEIFIQKLCVFYENEKLIEMIIHLINNKNICNEDVYFCLNYYFEFNKVDKKNIQIFLNQEKNEDNVLIIKLKTHILLFCIKYYQFFHISQELLSENNDDKKEIFFYFYILIQNNDLIDKYCKKYFKFNIINHFIDELLELYSKIINILKNNDLFNSDGNIHHLFKKKLFAQWYKHYKQLIQDDKMSDILKKYEIKKNIFNRFLCSHLNC